MIIGVTGGFASGKSTVAKMVAKALHAELLDADKIAHDVLENNDSAQKQVLAHFGRADRRFLARVVFSDSKKLKVLCDIIHPKVIFEIKNSAKEKLKINQNAYIVIDAPLLIEAGLTGFCDIVVVVSASTADICRRAVKHFHMNKNDALKRIKAQMPISKKKEYADYVIANNGSVKQLESDVKHLITKIYKEEQDGFRRT
ncbi:MAG: dephospho-CoA kinase [Candidatus Omnitrophota bacterium]